jgi:hypothetical protein
MDGLGRPRGHVLGLEERVLGGFRAGVDDHFGRYVGTVPNAGVTPEASPTRTMDWIAAAKAVHYIRLSFGNSEKIMEIRGIPIIF